VVEESFNCIVPAGGEGRGEGEHLFNCTVPAKNSERISDWQALKKTTGEDTGLKFL
jgi:hypothetical protein